MAKQNEQVGHKDLVGGGETTLHSHSGGSGHFGQATIPFSGWLNEDGVAVINQTGILATSKILVNIYADNDDVYAQDWRVPVIKDIVVGTGFSIALRSEIGTFKGAVKINWSWA